MKIIKYGIMLNPDKITHGSNSIKILDYVISDGKILPDPERMEPLLRMKAPNDKKSLDRIKGMFTYYSHWIPKFSDRIRPLANTSSFPLSYDALNSFHDL
ncbi:hypothetical protein GJ496_004092 [Pomphorhynchus laevis]|nr:hypothetical protein GJ496_004092 [Pomphorhynchus laevis]